MDAIYMKNESNFRQCRIFLNSKLKGGMLTLFDSPIYPFVFGLSTFTRGLICRSRMRGEETELDRLGFENLHAATSY